MHGHSHPSSSALTSNRISAWVSIACAIHCALTPLVLSVLPLVGLEFLASHSLEIVLLSAGLGFGIYGVLKAYFRQHRDLMPVMFVLAGAVIVILGLFWVPESMEPMTVPSGAILVGVAQVVNIRKIRACEKCVH